MAARATWKGTVGFGLVSVPVKLYTALDDKDIHFNQLHKDIDPATGKEVLTKINLKKVCPYCGKTVANEEIISGKQVGDKWITVTDQEKANCTIKSTKTLEILAFVPAEKIDPRHFGESHFLGPDDAGKKAFHLLLKAMASENRVAITKITQVSREKLCCIRAYGKLLLLQELCYADELRSTAEVETALPDVSDKEISMGVMLMKQMEEDNPDMTVYHNVGREKLADLIEKKAQGVAITVDTVEAMPPTEDLLTALMNSLNQKPEPAGNLAGAMVSAAESLGEKK